jgi:hypothetical protein
MVASEKAVDSGNMPVLHKKVKSYEKHRKMLLVSLFVVIALIIVVSFSLMQLPLPYAQPPGVGDQTTGQSGKNVLEIVAEKAEECIASNPSLTEEQCWDLGYHDMSIAIEDPGLCRKIKDGRLRSRCEGYFD